ncbi:PQQ-binding-like beta-propeller repeat protein [Streptomyces sp. NPDC002896]|uniref:PQQ-like beta-propeller repeat protein n=1 Tax=Streptomyces sp. NPDC002896 TaxID=3154438 RepID=UPI003323B50C
MSPEGAQVVDDRPPLTITASAGKGLWTLSAPTGTLGQPVVVGGTVYVPVSGDRIAAVDAHEGRIRWCSEALTKPAPERLVCAGGAVVVPVLRDRDPGGFTALDAATGKVLWTRRKSELDRMAAAGSTVVLWNDTREERGEIAGVDALTGETLWEDGFKRIWGVLVRGERVILDAGGFRALDARTGEEVWDEGYGDLLGQDGTTGDAALFHSWSGGGLATLSVRAYDTGKALSTTRFPQRALKHFSRPPALVDGGRVLFSETFGRRVRVFACAGVDRAESLGRPRLSRLRFTSFSDPAVCVGDWVYALTWRHRLHAAEIGGRRRLRRLSVVAPDGRVVREPNEIAAGPEHLFVSDRDSVAAIRDGRVLWVAATDVWGNPPVPLGADRVLFRSANRKARRDRLHCAEAETGRRLS